MSLPEALERAAAALPDHADLIRPANGDPAQLLSSLDALGCQAVLGWLLANEPVAGEELMLEWCEDDRGIENVKSIDGHSLPKTGKKLLRKALHRMRTSGIEVAALPSAKPPSASRLADVSDEIAGAYMTSVDPRGSVLLFLVEANPSGGARLFQISLDELRGIVEFDVYATGRSKTRSFLRKLTDASATGASGAVQVDSAFARGLIARIASIHPRSRPFPRAFSEWRRKLEAGGSDLSSTEWAKRAVGNATTSSTTTSSTTTSSTTTSSTTTSSTTTSSEAIARVAERVRSREIGPWPPTTSQLSAVSTSLGDAVDAIVAAGGDAKAAALDDAKRAATELLFEGAHPEHTAARFESSAYVAKLNGENDRAIDLLAAAQSFRTGAYGDNPIARAMTEAFTASILKRLEDAKPDSSADANPPES